MPTLIVTGKNWWRSRLQDVIWHVLERKERIRTVNNWYSICGDFRNFWWFWKVLF